jgi:hypothetical protein
VYLLFTFSLYIISRISDSREKYFRTGTAVKASKTLALSSFEMLFLFHYFPSHILEAKKRFEFLLSSSQWLETQGKQDVKEAVICIQSATL